MSEAKATFSDSDKRMTAERSVIIEPGFAVRNWWLLRCAFVAAFEDNCFAIAKGVAFSFMLSLFPILTTLAALLFEVNARGVVHVIARFAQEVLPPGTEELVLSRLRERTGRPISLPLVAIGLSLWAGSGAMASLLEGFQAAYRIPSGRPMLKQRGMAIFLVLIAAFPAVAASSLVIFGNRIEVALIHWRGIEEISAPVHAVWEDCAVRSGFCGYDACDWTALLLWAESQTRAAARQREAGLEVCAGLARGDARNLVMAHCHRWICLLCRSFSELQHLLRQLGNGGDSPNLAVSSGLHHATGMRIQRGAGTHCFAGWDCVSLYTV